MTLVAAKFLQGEDVVMIGSFRSLYRVTGFGQDGSVNASILCRHAPADPVDLTIPCYQGVEVLNTADLSKHHEQHPDILI